MKKFTLILMSLMFVSFGALAQAPNADFAASNTNIEAWDGIDFTDFSTGSPTSWQWSFYGADPGTSTDQNPSDIYYYYTGTYPVTLTVTNANGTDTENKTAYITVSEPRTQLSTPQCNGSVNLHNGTSFYFIPVAIGLEYAEDYKITIISNGGPFYYKSVTTGGHASSILKSSFPGLQYGRNYNCVIQAKFNGSWGSFGPTCGFYTTSSGLFRTGREGDNAVTQLKTNFFPNPADGNGFNLNLTGLTNEVNQIQIDIYDLYGKQVYSKQINHGKGELLTKITPTESLSSGVYLVRVDINGEVLQEKLQVK